LSAEQTLELWCEYQRTGDQRLRDRLVLTFAPMVKYIVYRKIREMPARCEVDDFISCGLEALIKSIDRYDPDKGATLEQFAWTRIHGAVLDELRRNDWAPRSLRRMDREIGKARDNFLNLYGRRPSREELADALGIQVKDLVRHQDEISRASVGSLNALVNGEEDMATERIDTLISDDTDADPEQFAITGEAKERFREAFECLAPRERKIAVLLYVYNLTLREIGEILGVTESRVCQLHAQILKTLRARLAADEQLFNVVAA
jgi:RNA polymerase sigma factor for flagellar operon FliA